MFKVKDFMTTDVITCEPDEKITKVIDLMNSKKIHRLPVVDPDGKLLGIITEGMIAGANNSATSLSIFELNYLLSKTDVKTVMIKNVISIDENELMEAAAQKMLQHDIGCLPVVNGSKKVVGILTQNDIFKSFLDVLGWEHTGSRITLEVKDEIGALEKISRIFADNHISISNIGVYSSKDGVASMVIRSDAKEVDGIKKALEDGGYTVREAILVQ
ncbi:CBS and ACT domain-containing protein [uncultured Dubosiella sp.]|uniref:CBS and ACT domain-containing protein n=1 Tax=uncultured Dubosiella sp. TaxID=1937011 RepID=UPI002616A047|nr:CBS and ACT domain-containing protein [uncultured Dubosiella sp.]